MARDRDAQSSHAHHAHGGAGNVLLDTAAGIVARILARAGFALAAPVTADFKVDETGSSGVGVTVKLEDPGQAAAALAAIAEYLGGQHGVDAVHVS